MSSSVMANDLESSLGIKIIISDTPTDEEIMEKYMPSMWANEEKHILDENTFAKAFTEVENLRYYNGVFFTRRGRVSEEFLLREIWESVAPVGINKDVERICKKLLGAVKMAATVKHLTINPNLIPFSNGDFYTDTMEFHLGEFAPTAYRLKAPLRREFEPIPYFTRWLKSLISEEDIPVLRQYLAYTLLPTTRGQKALFLVGEGGGGKSGIGVILEEIFGDAMISTLNSQEFMTDKFKAAELENKLVLYDDDLDNKALEGTGLYKKLITNNLVISADRKYGQPFSFTPYARLITCCNEMISASDTTDGFYRRLLPIKTLPKPKDFVPDPHYYDHLRDEVNGIVQWLLFGLNALIDNNFVLPESERTKAYLEGKKRYDNPFPDFFSDVFEPCEEDGTTLGEIISAFKSWCKENSVPYKTQAEIKRWFDDNAERGQYEGYSNLVYRNGKRVRGYRFIRIKQIYANSGKITLI